MTRLRDLAFEPAYDKSVDNIADDFYLPCMHASVRYDRIAGYFSSAVFSVAWPALKDFVAAHGRMRLICSPVFSSVDRHALESGYEAMSDDELSQALINELNILLESPRSRKPAQVLAGLIASGVVEVRVAVVAESASPTDRRLFHDKVGLFTDPDGDAVGFRGSMNETYLGLSPDGNLESIDVFPSWEGGRDARRAEMAQERFEQLWNNEIPSVTVRTVPDAAGLVIRDAAPADWEVLIDEVVAESNVRRRAAPEGPPLRDHQVAALGAWELHHRRGVLEHATGSGKTFTAVNAIRAVFEDDGVAIVLVPSALLLSQWRTEITRFLADLSPQILLVGDGNEAWRTEDLLFPFTRPREPGQSPRVVIATVQSASSDAFLTRIARNDRLLVVADEAHRLGSPSAQRLLTIDAPWRLGLSATPRRAGDADGTERLLSYFGGILEPVYSLRDAIRDRVLTPYNYFPHPAELSAPEQADYDDLSRKLRLEAGRRGDALGNVEANERLKRLAIARARVLKRASAKVPLAVQVVQDTYRPGDRWLVYCDGIAQLNDVRRALGVAGFETLEYHSEMRGDRAATLAELDLNGGILVSVKCLDEGIDLPAVDHALVLASSKNPREFIQRRGRILRKAQGKTLAFLHDAVVVPAPDEGSGRTGRDHLLAGELGRTLEFARGAANPQALSQIEALCVRYGLPIEPIAVDVSGVEGDEEGDDEYE